MMNMLTPWGALGQHPTVADYQRAGVRGWWKMDQTTAEENQVSFVHWIPEHFVKPGSFQAQSFGTPSADYNSPYFHDVTDESGDTHRVQWGSLNDVADDNDGDLFLPQYGDIALWRIGDGSTLLGKTEAIQDALSQVAYDPLYGNVIPAALGRQVQMTGAESSFMDVFQYAPMVMAVAFTAGAASGAFAAYTVAEGAAVTGAGAAAGAAEAGSLSVEGGATLEAASALDVTGEAGLEYVSEETAATAFEAVEPMASAPASSTMSMPPDMMPSAPPAGGGFSMPSVSTIAQKALPLALKAIAKPGGQPVTTPRTVAAPQPLYLTGSNAGYLTDYQNNRMLWIAGGVIAALGLAFFTRREGKRQ